MTGIKKKNFEEKSHLAYIYWINLNGLDEDDALVLLLYICFLYIEWLLCFMRMSEGLIFAWNKISRGFYVPSQKWNFVVIFFP